MEKAQRPLFLIGGGVRISHAEKELTMLVELTGVPVVTTIMGKGSIATDHPLYFGNVGIHGAYGANTAINECDVLFSIGTRFNDRVAGNKNTFARNAKIIHVDIDTASISRNVAVDVPIVGDAAIALKSLNERLKPLSLKKWIDRLNELKSAYPIKISSDKLNPQSVIEKLNTLFDELIVTTDVGQNQLWTTQFLRLNEKRRLITSGGLGTMGFGLPAAIGAKLGNPRTPVVAVVGDGGFQMNIQELATAVINNLPVIICLFNNNWLGNVRQWQELYYERRYQSTCLKRRNTCPKHCNGNIGNCPVYVPDFAKLADSYCIGYKRIEQVNQIDEAFEFALNNTSAPTLLEFMIEEEENVYPIVLPGKDLSTVKFGKES